MKKKIIPVVIVIIALLIGCVGYICYTNNEVKKYSAKIEKQLDKMDQLKGEAYFLPEHEKDLKNLKKNYETAKSNKSVGDGICWNCMRSEMKSHFKMETAKKRQPTEIIMTKVSSAEDEVIALEILKSVMENLTIRQQNIITLKLLGYSNTEICLMMEMSKSSYYRELENIRQTIVDGKF